VPRAFASSSRGRSNARPAGAVNVSDVSLVTTTFSAGTSSTKTVVAPALSSRKPLPVTVSVVAGASNGISSGETAAIAGRSA
jgi:hypothetical protein